MPTESVQTASRRRLDGATRRLIRINATARKTCFLAGNQTGRLKAHGTRLFARPDAGHRPDARPRHRPVPHPPPHLVQPAAALQQRLPRRRGHPGLARPRPGRTNTARRGKPWSPTIRCPATHGRVCYHPVRNRLQSRRNGRPGRRSTPSSASSATARQPKTGISRRPPRPPASGCWSSAPARPACPPPITSPGSAIRSKSMRPARSPAACCISASPPIACREPNSPPRSPASSASG